MSQRPAHRRWATVVVVSAAVVGLLLGALWFGQRSLIYLPDRSTPPAAADVLPGAQDVTLTTSDGLQLGAWYVPPSGDCGGTVLIAPGNGGNRAGRASLGRAVADRGFGVLLFDYRGYGGNEGRPSEHGLRLDVRAARDHLVSHGAEPETLVYLGESIGAAVVAELAAEHPPAALVLRSPFTSLADAARAAYGVPLGWLLRDDFDVLASVARVQVPVAVVHGSEDGIVPPRQSVEVAEAARAGGSDVVEVEVAGAGHNDPALAEGPELIAALTEVAGRGGITGCG